MSNQLFYKGFYGTVEYCSESDILHGQIAGIHGLFMYHGDSLQALKEDFYDSVESYLALCEENGLNPHTPPPNINSIAI
jgi:predicted HicB family RNase H-like nuclease